jgi:hypothetical protein
LVAVVSNVELQDGTYQGHQQDHVLKSDDGLDIEMSVAATKLSEDAKDALCFDELDR